MSYLEFGGRRHPIPVGEVALGCDSAGQVVLGTDVQSPYAILQSTPDGQVAIRGTEADAEILINGVRLGPQPTPLLHGDKVELTEQELLFVDDRRSGSTQFIQAVDPASMQEMFKTPAGKVATAGTGGRLVSLTDGREYSISGGSLLLGRDAGCDVVVASKNVSRRHAEIVATPKGYILIDSSTNGTFVNGDRIQGQKLLARADVVRCGDHEFRFYADVKPQEPEAAEPVESTRTPEPAAVAPPPPPPESAKPEPPSPPPESAKPEPRLPGTPVPPPAEPPQPPSGAEHRLANTMHGIPVVPRRPAQPPQPLGKTPPEGAERRLADTMHGIPIVPRPAKPEPDPPKETPPAGAESRLSDTLLGVPAAPRPARPAVPGSGPALDAKDSKRQSAGKWPMRPAQPAAAGSTAAPEHEMGKDAGDENVYPRTGEREAVAHAEIRGKPAAPISLASLIVRNGPLKGRHFEITVPVVNVGRADYNDIVLVDDSVSTVHAKIQRREGIWVLVDQESTNGTVVDGQRIKAETVLTPGALIRFGSVQTMFQPTDDSVGSQKGGATRVMQPLEMSSQEDERRGDSSSLDS